jgi:hypothetical protein
MLDVKVPDDLDAVDVRHHWHPYTDMAAFADDPLVIRSGTGSWVTDTRGRRYFDAISGLWNTNLGHGRTDIVDAVANQLRDLAYQPLNGRSHIPATLLAERLAQVSPGDLNRVFFATGGAEAVETAIKIARQFWQYSAEPRRTKIVGLQHGWHGCTLGALAASGVAEEKTPFEPLAGGFLQFIPPAGGWSGECAPGAVADALERLLEQAGADTVAALIGEPVQGLAGMVAPAASFWREVREVCARHRILLIADEVAMGFGRTGRMFSFEHYDLQPDLVTCAKGITAGYLPLSAVLVSNHVFEPFGQAGRAFLHGYTWGGHPAACAAGLRTLEILVDEQLCDRARWLGESILAQLRDGLAGRDGVIAVRGIGLAIAVQLTRPIAAGVCDQLRARNVLVRPVGAGDTVPLLPPLTTSERDARDIADIYVDVIRQLHS